MKQNEKIKKKIFLGNFFNSNQRPIFIKSQK